MKQLIALIVLGFVGFMGFRIGGELSPDAFGMAVGLLFGVMAGIPTALILLASQRREQPHSDRHERQPQHQIEQQQPQQVTNNYITHNYLHVHNAPGLQRSRQAEVTQRHQLPGSAPGMVEPRRFRIIGEVSSD